MSFCVIKLDVWGTVICHHVLQQMKGSYISLYHTSPFPTAVRLPISAATAVLSVGLCRNACPHYRRVILPNVILKRPATVFSHNAKRTLERHTWTQRGALPQTSTQCWVGLMRKGICELKASSFYCA